MAYLLVSVTLRFNYLMTACLGLIVVSTALTSVIFVTVLLRQQQGIKFDLNSLCFQLEYCYPNWD